MFDFVQNPLSSSAERLRAILPKVTRTYRSSKAVTLVKIIKAKKVVFKGKILPSGDCQGASSPLNGFSIVYPRRRTFLRRKASV